MRQYHAGGVLRVWEPAIFARVDSWIGRANACNNSASRSRLIPRARRVRRYASWPMPACRDRLGNRAKFQARRDGARIAARIHAESCSGTHTGISLHGSALCASRNVSLTHVNCACGLHTATHASTMRPRRQRIVRPHGVEDARVPGLPPVPHDPLCHVARVDDLLPADRDCRARGLRRLARPRHGQCVKRSVGSCGPTIRPGGMIRARSGYTASTTFSHNAFRPPERSARDLFDRFILERRQRRVV